LKRYRWPGNVRELQNVMERAVIMSGDRVSLLDLPEEIVAENDFSDHQNGASPLRVFRDKMEREFILNALLRNHGNISQSAIELGIGRTYLHRRLASLRITKKDWLG
jgi:transcriptional regulator of acetoin/glycerol metabolism